MSKVLKFIIKIDDNGTFKGISANAEQLKEAIHRVQNESEKVKDSILTWTNVAKSAETIQKSISELQSVMSDLTQAYQVQLLAETQLETIMRQRMGSTDEAIQSIKDYCSAQQQIGIIGDEVQLSGAQQMATFLQEEQSLKTLIPAMNNLLAQQKGLNATNQDAVGIGNLIGKVMQGQTSALKRVGISFTEAQEQVLKMGNEQQRAAMLAQVITDNVGNMNAVLAQTDAGQQKQLENTLGDIKEQIGAIAQSIMPYVTFAAQLTTCAANAIKLTASVKAVAAAFTIASLKAKALAVHQTIVSIAQKLLAATGYTAAAGTTALTVATAALYATLTCGISVALTALASLFIDTGDAADDAAKSINGNTQAIEDNASALTQADRIKKAVSEVQENASSHYADEISKIKSLTSVIHDSNAKYADRLKAIRNLQSIIPGYHAQIQKDGTIFERNAAAVDKYIQKLEDLAMAEAAFDKIKDIGKQIVTLRIKQQQYKKQAQDIDTTIRTENGGKGADQLNNPLNRFHFPTQDAAPTDAVNQNGTINFDYLRDKANAQVQSRQHQERLSSQLNAHTIATGQAADLGTQIDEEIQAILGILTPTQRSTYNGIAANGGYVKGGGAPSLATPGKGSHATTHTPSTANTTQDNEPQEGSLKYYDDKISKLRQEAQATSDLTQAQSLLAQATQLQAKRKDLAIKLGIEAPDKAQVTDQMEVLKQQLQQAEKDYEQADTIELKLDAKDTIDTIRGFITQLQGQRLALQLQVDPEAGKQAIQDYKRTKYSEAQSKATTIQTDLANGLIDESEARRQIKALNDDLSAEFLGANFKPITLQVDTQEAEQGIKHFATQSRKAWSGITSGVDAVQSLTETLQGNGTVWEKLTAVVNTFFTVMDSVTSIIEVINALTKVSTATKQADTQATNQDTTAKLGNAGATAIEAGAEATKQGSSLPFPANIAAIAVGVAAVVAAIATISSLAFESGGIVPGTSYTGDHITARVNSGEMILNPRQQANLWRLANTHILPPTTNTPNINPTTPTLNLAALRANLQAPQVNVSMSGRIRGRDIVTVLANETRTNRRPTNIHI